MIKKADISNNYAGMRYRPFIFEYMHQADAASGWFCR